MFSFELCARMHSDQEGHRECEIQQQKNHSWNIPISYLIIYYFQLRDHSHQINVEEQGGEWERKESEREEIEIEMELKAPHISYLKSEQIERDLIDFKAEMHDMGEYYYWRLAWTFKREAIL